MTLHTRNTNKTTIKMLKTKIREKTLKQLGKKQTQHIQREKK